ncbi:MAG: DUF6675 family protein [Treponemataceae bacterium]
MKKAVLIVWIFVYTLPLASFPISLGDLVGDKNAQVLRSDTSVKSMSVNVLKPQLTPKGESGIRLETHVTQFGPNVIVEALYLYKRPSASPGKTWSESERVMTYNVLRSLSTLSGIEYYSASRGHMRVFYEKSYVINGADGKTALPDPVVDSVPEVSTIFALQKDLTFGENRYRYDYMAAAQDFSFIQTNLTHMSYGIVPLIGKDGLKTIVLVSDNEEGFLLYAVSAVKTMLLPGIGEKVKTSFSNRADAIYRWFSLRMDAGFAQEPGKK